MVKLCFKPSLRSLIKRLWIKEVRGIEHVSNNLKAMVVVNHQSVLDPLLISVVVPSLTSFVFDAGEPYRTLFLRCFCKCVDIAKEGDNSMSICCKELNENKFLCIFGEVATICKEVGRIALVAKVPIVPIGITGAADVWQEEKFMPYFRKEIIITIGTPILLDNFYGSEKDDEICEKIVDIASTEAGKLSGNSFSPQGEHPKTAFDPNKYIYRL